MMRLPTRTLVGKDSSSSSSSNYGPPYACSFFKGAAATGRPAASRMIWPLRRPPVASTPEARSAAMGTGVLTWD